MQETTLSKTQKQALLIFGGKAPADSLQSNHFLNGFSALIRKGFARQEYVGMSVKSELTEAGKALLASL